MAARRTVGDFSRFIHLSVKTRHRYHRVGLLEPAGGMEDRDWLADLPHRRP